MARLFQILTLSPKDQQVSPKDFGERKPNGSSQVKKRRGYDQEVGSILPKKKMIKQTPY
jgi:hypothetical protein